MEDHVRRGQRARDAGRWTEAHDAYKAALDAAEAGPSTALERAELAGELGLCELALRRYREAAEHLTRALQRRGALSTRLRQRFEVGRVKATFCITTLVIAVDPPDAEVVIDGQPVGAPRPSYTLFFEPGQHMVRARAPGREEAFHSFSAMAGAEYTISMQLPRAAVSSPGEAPPATPKALSSSTATQAQPPGPWASWPGTLRIAGIGLTAATASLGAVFMVRASGSHGDLQERNRRLDAEGVARWACREPPRPAACAELTRLRRERDLFAGLGTALVITGGVVGAATVASFLIDFGSLRAGPTEARVTLSPTVTPAALGLVAHGAW
ncbi:PEGA domain-containing protein [Sorangium sp. So ce291]|uniref:PEGA domain-containing protein n=1 Tax=Sorangium sp. So ce291 TaxID=3133294 RepID=UPI003F5F25BC